MRKALALLATVGAFMMLSVGIVSAQEYDGTTDTTPTTEPGTETVVPTTDPPATTAPPATDDDGIAGEGDETAPGVLPATGSDSLPLAQLAIVLVAAGGIALMAVRRTPAKVSAGS